VLVDDLLYAARRASMTATVRSEPSGDLDSRFRVLVQSPLRAGILRFLSARLDEAFDTEALMAAFGRMRLDVENCVRELAAFGVIRRLPGAPARYTGVRPAQIAAGPLLEAFLERSAAVSTEDQSPSVQRFREMIGRDEKMLVVFEWIRTAAKSDIAVLILGPTGSGKEVVARMIHELSRRNAARFQAVNCAALPDTLFESEMFGYERGAFTGAHDRKPGRLEMAAEGTLFLDEVGDLSMVAQAKLLRVLEDHRFERLGGNQSIQVDFRLISATNRPLDLFVRDGRFREDLFYRVNAFAIRLPSLRERPVDIPVLAQRFLARYCAAHGLPLDAKVLSKDAVDAFITYPWPGNIRELESTVSRAALSAPGRTIRAADVEFLHLNTSAPPIGPGPDRMPTLADVERSHISRVLEATGWNKKEAARILDVSRGTLYRKIEDYHLAPPAPAGSQSETPGTGDSRPF
jgi:transcriptional regulator with PAS, ATPase and Fis domain